ncbi:hypothetical protein N7490_002731 [Penicillium lividum]|nr:hypothetical protein N7490_002731 [Penicillium lividum]
MKVQSWQTWYLYYPGSILNGPTGFSQWGRAGSPIRYSMMRVIDVGESHGVMANITNALCLTLRTHIFHV